MIGTTSSGTLIVLFGMYVVYVHAADFVRIWRWHQKLALAIW
jgi:hypothetical protein